MLGCCLEQTSLEATVDYREIADPAYTSDGAAMPCPAINTCSLGFDIFSTRAATPGLNADESQTPSLPWLEGVY